MFNEKKIEKKLSWIIPSGKYNQVKMSS